ncbi:MAG: 4Fe-4S dicluster domain-containing protein [Halanaerobiales bacterium]|nr:4Fe-4S dicluster domain-containing protein [Halanaerobiales bacterium]
MLREKITPDTTKKEIGQISEISDEKILDCLQCGKCTAGCPAIHGMDIMPHQVIRLLQLGQVDKLLASTTIWGCAACFTCLSRCPRKVDLSKIMEALRLIVLRTKGNQRLEIDKVPELLAKQIPQQAIVSGFRKYVK